MKKLFLIVVLAAMSIPALGDGTATLIRWPGWRCQSTEDLSLGRRHTSFPLTYLFDGNPATAWVFSGTGKHMEYWPTGFGLTLVRDEESKPVTVDSVWIMNGYNKSRELFLRNNRITELKLFVNSKYAKTVSLTDAMGWHKISIPRQTIMNIGLVFTKFNKGRDDDVCVSEIALHDRGREVDLRMPKLVEFTEGDVDCGCGQEWQVIDRSGKKLVTYDLESPTVWSPSGLHLAVVLDGELLVMDAAKATVSVRQRLFKNDSYHATVQRWHGERSIDVGIDKCFPTKGKGPDYKLVQSKRTIKIAGG